MSDKTQCPSCGTIYPMPKDKLSDPNVRANCGRCKKSFLLNKHLVAKQVAPKSPTKVNPPKPAQSTANHTAQTNAKAPPKTTQIQATKNNEPLIIGANELIGDDLSLPKIPMRQKKSKPLPTDGMIFDEMDSDDDSSVDFGDDLDDFLNSEPIIQDHYQSSQDKNSVVGEKEDAWLDELLKDTTPSEKSPLLAQNPKDDLSQILGVDLTAAIPEAVKSTPAKVALAPKAPTQQQLASYRPLSYYLGWGMACLGLVGLLLAQYVFFNANAIAKHSKNAALVNAVCLDCLPSANLQALMTDYTLSKGQADYTTDLLGTLSNLSDQDQLYPNLKITVLGATGVAGELALAPSDYLPFAGQHRLSAKQNSRFLLTLDVPYNEVKSVVIEPFY